MHNLEKALKLAKSAHKGQKYGAHDYFDYHIMSVVNLLEKEYSSFFNHSEKVPFERMEDVLSGAALHDIVEDTDIGLDDLNGFPNIVREIVHDMTKTVGYTEYILHLADFGSQYSRAVKMADLTVNILSLIHISEPTRPY